MKRLPFIAFLVCCLLLPACGGAKVKEYRVKVVNEYPHDIGAYTQGLFFFGNSLIETTGQYGESSLREVDLESGKILRKVDFNSKYFAEGSVAMDGDLFILTWTNKVAFRYDPETFAYRGTLGWPKEGWGLTTDGKRLIISDGTSNLYFVDKSFKIQKTIKARLDGRPVRLLNELEWIDGKIWANVYMTDLILIINPEDGAVEATVDCSGLLPQSLRTDDTDVLNGIACLGKRVFLTGKNWPRLYEVRLERK